MSKEKISIDMTTEQVLITMCDGNPGALQVLMQMLNDSNGLMNILACDSLGIRGVKLYLLYNDCCDRDFNKFNRTLELIKKNVFTEKEIEDNLNLTRAIPFIDDDIVIEGVPPYYDEFGPKDEKWNEYCEKNKELFKKRLSEKLENNKRM